LHFKVISVATRKIREIRDESIAKMKAHFSLATKQPFHY